MFPSGRCKRLTSIDGWLKVNGSIPSFRSKTLVACDKKEVSPTGRVSSLVFVGLGSLKVEHGLAKSRAHGSIPARGSI